MARRISKSAEPPRPASLTATQIRESIPKLERRVRELEAVKINGWDDNIKRDLDALHTRVEETLTQVFGHDTLERKRYHVRGFWTSIPIYMNRRTTPQEYIHHYTSGVADGISTLKNAISMLQEQLEDMGESPTGQALQAYEGLELHPEIDRAAGALYRGGHYANAIEDAVKALNGLVRLRSGVELDGSKLMEQVFNPSNPVLKFNALADQSDRDEQRGFMMMFAGAVAGLRNPRAHKLIKDDPERALEFIAYISLLAKLLDGAVKA
jgi:uncharacterized protein (TIGR02391 family)